MKTPNNGFTVKSHFEGRDPAVRQIYDRVLKAAGKFGPVIEDPKKTSIHLVNKTAFAGVATRKSGIILTIKSDRKIPSPRIHKSEQTSARRFHHEVKLNLPAEVDSEVVEWLKDAYAQANSAGARVVGLPKSTSLRRHDLASWRLCEK